MIFLPTQIAHYGFEGGSCHPTPRDSLPLDTGLRRPQRIKNNAPGRATRPSKVGPSRPFIHFSSLLTGGPGPTRPGRAGAPKPQPPTHPSARCCIISVRRACQQIFANFISESGKAERFLHFQLFSIKTMHATFISHPSHRCDCNLPVGGPTR